MFCKSMYVRCPSHDFSILRIDNGSRISHMLCKDWIHPPVLIKLFIATEMDLDYMRTVFPFYYMNTGTLIKPQIKVQAHLSSPEIDPLSARVSPHG